MTPLGKLNTLTVYVTVLAAMSTTTTADPKAAVLRPGAGVSPAPVSVAFNVNVSAAAGAAWNPARTIATDTSVINRHVMATLLLSSGTNGRARAGHVPARESTVGHRVRAISR